METRASAVRAAEEQLAAFLPGRALLFPEICSRFPQFSETILREAVASLAEKGKVELHRGIEPARAKQGGREPSRFWQRCVHRLFSLLSGNKFLPVAFGHKGLRCLRCGETERIVPVDCARCGQPCYYCDNCVAMGRSSACSLYVYGLTEEGAAASVDAAASANGEAATIGAAVTEAETAVGVESTAVEKPAMSSLLVWEGRLTPAQERAAARAAAYARERLEPEGRKADGKKAAEEKATGRKAMERDQAHGNEKELLIWAVCGAGKTEVVFFAIDEVVRRGGKVLLATPRKDVVLELAPRLSRVFPACRVLALHGGSREKWEEGEITIATTHQALRFYRRFDLVILDEVDAFPFHNNPMLYYGVKRAAKERAGVIYLTATPPEELRRLVRKGEVECVRIAARYHGHPLPVPKLVLAPRLRQKIAQRRKVPSLDRFLTQVMEGGRQAFLFVPAIRDVSFVVAYLRDLYPHWSPVIAGSHSRDQEREQKVQQVRAGKIRLFVTTTIMERGVTIPRCDVLVLWADAPVFDEASLVQIAGRVGRAASDPGGEVVFVSAMRTRAQVRAVRHIKEMNRWGKETLRSRR
ncbi:hypothetical protein BSNK01_30430 [Bacillaceae bacterium]